MTSTKADGSLDKKEEKKCLPASNMNGLLAYVGSSFEDTFIDHDKSYNNKAPSSACFKYPQVIQIPGLGEPALAKSALNETLPLRSKSAPAAFSDQSIDPLSSLHVHVWYQKDDAYYAGQSRKSGDRSGSQT